MSKDAIVELISAPSAKLIAIAFLGLGFVFGSGQAWAAFQGTQTSIEQHEQRIAQSEQQIEELKRLRLIDSFNLYLVCRADNPSATDCKKPE